RADRRTGWTEPLDGGTAEALSVDPLDAETETRLLAEGWIIAVVRRAGAAGASRRREGWRSHARDDRRRPCDRGSRADPLEHLSTRNTIAGHLRILRFTHASLQTLVNSPQRVCSSWATGRMVRRP